MGLTGLPTPPHCFYWLWHWTDQTYSRPWSIKGEGQTLVWIQRLINHWDLVSLILCYSLFLNSLVFVNNMAQAWLLMNRYFFKMSFCWGLNVECPTLWITWIIVGNRLLNRSIFLLLLRPKDYVVGQLKLRPIACYQMGSKINSIDCDILVWPLVCNMKVHLHT